MSCRQRRVSKQHLHSTQQKSLHTPKTECGRTRTAGTEPRHEQPHLEVDSICEHHGVCNNIQGTLKSKKRFLCAVVVAGLCGGVVCVRCVHRARVAGSPSHVTRHARAEPGRLHPCFMWRPSRVEGVEATWRRTGQPRRQQHRCRHRSITKATAACCSPHCRRPSKSRIKFEKCETGACRTQVKERWEANKPHRHA